MTTSRDLELLGDECLFWASDFPHEGIVDMSKAVNEFLEPRRYSRSGEAENQLRQSEEALSALRLASSNRSSVQVVKEIRIGLNDWNVLNGLNQDLSISRR